METMLTINAVLGITLIIFALIISVVLSVVVNKNKKDFNKIINELKRENTFHDKLYKICFNRIEVVEKNFIELRKKYEDSNEKIVKIMDLLQNQAELNEIIIKNSPKLSKTMDETIIKSENLRQKFEKKGIIASDGKINDIYTPGTQSSGIAAN